MVEVPVDSTEGHAFDHAFEVGGFWIIPVGSTRPHSNEIGLEIEVGGVFGSGLHPTTRLCIERLIELPEASSMLDVGAGTGILGLVSLRLGTKLAVLLDSDPRALEVSARNAARNQLRARVRLESRPLRALDERFPLVVVNMPSAELVELAPALARCLAPGGRLVASGVYETQQGDVRRVFRDLGMHTGAATTRSGWCCFEAWPSW